MSSEHRRRGRGSPEGVARYGCPREDEPLPPDPAVIPRTAYDFWLFDLDGTLVDIESSYVRTLFDRIGDRLGRRFTDTQAETLWYGMGDRREACLNRLGIDVDRFWTAFHRAEEPTERATATYLYDDASVIESFDRPVGLVTHCQRYLTEPVLEALDVLDWFDAIVCCSDTTGWKPDPAPVERAMADLGVLDGPRRGVLVGDDPYDTGAAWNAGLDGIHVERGDPIRRGQAVPATHRVSSLRAISDT